MGEEDTTTRNTSDVILTIFLCLMCVLSILGNFTVFITILGSRKLRKINSAFLLNLSICDICLSIVFIPLAVNGIVKQRWEYGKTSCVITGFLINVFSIGSISTITAVALDRYLAIIHCLKYSSWSSWKYISLFMVMIWTEAIASSIPALCGDWGIVTYHEQRRICLITWKYHPSYAIYMTVITFVLPVSVMLFSYCNIIKVARLHARKIGDINSQITRNSLKCPSNIPADGYIALAFMDPINKLSMMGFPCAEHCKIITNLDFDFNTNGSTNSGSTVSTSRLQREFKAMLRLLGLILAFVVCWSLHVYKEAKEAIDTYMHRESTFSDIFVLFSMLFIVLHTTWDPFIYAIGSKRFRFVILNMCSKLSGRKISVVRVRGVNHSNILSTMKNKNFTRGAQASKTCSKISATTKSGYICQSSKSREFTVRNYTSVHLKVPIPVISSV